MHDPSSSDEHDPGECPPVRGRPQECVSLALSEHVPLASEAVSERRFGPVHDHQGRPGTVYVLAGTITDHRDGIATDYGPGVGWPEDRNTVHWLENRGTVTATEISVDVIECP